MLTMFQTAGKRKAGEGVGDAHEGTCGSKRLNGVELGPGEMVM